MKKFVYFIALLIVTLLSSCESEAEQALPENVIIKMSHNGPSQASKMQKISPLGDSPSGQSISNGDTVNIYDLQDVNIIFTAENGNGYAVKGTWSIILIDVEIGLTNNDPNLFLLDRPGAGDHKTDMISFKPEKLGLYQITFTMFNGYSTKFYLRHFGTPGKIGDNWEAQYIFRMENNIIQKGNEAVQAYSFYLISEEYIFNRKVKALVFSEIPENEYYKMSNGMLIRAKEFMTHKCKYSPGYVCFSILKKDVPAINGQYRIIYYSGNYGEDWYISENAFNSNWSVNGEIVFNIF